MKALALSIFVFMACASADAYNKVVAKNLLTRTVTLPAGTKTAAIDLGGLTLVGIQLGALTGTALTFEASDAIDGTFVAVKAGTGGSALSYTVAQNTFVAIDPKDFWALNYIKIVSGSSEGSDRTLILTLKGF